MSQTHYDARRLLREFDDTVRRVGPFFVARYGEAQTSTLIQESREEFEHLIPSLPYIGGRQPHTRFILSAGWFLAMYRRLKARGGTVEEAGLLIYQASQAFLQAYPSILRRLLGRMTFSPRYVRRLRKRAMESQSRRYPGDYVYTFVEGDKNTFDFGVDYLECATTKFLRDQGAGELAPYLCTVDRLYSEAFGWGLVRTMTLAEGHDRCDFRFKPGGPTRVSIPARLETALRQGGA